jgi:hypothetical protein
VGYIGLTDSTDLIVEVWLPSREDGGRGEVVVGVEEVVEARVAHLGHAWSCRHLRDVVPCLHGVRVAVDVAHRGRLERSKGVS